MGTILGWAGYVVRPSAWPRRWQDRIFQGHLSLGRLTIYGANAMHWTVSLHTRRWGYVCFHPTTRTFGGLWPWYFYLSPNGTPWAATFVLGPGHGGSRKMARLRRILWGHGYDCEKHDPQKLAAYVESFAGSLPA